MKKFAIIKKDFGVYKSTKIIYNSVYLYMLTSVFTDQLSFAIDIKNELENPYRRGMAGNEIRIEVEGRKITISYLYAVDEYITIDRLELIKIMDKAITLMEAEADYLVLMQQDENSPIEVTDQPPEGMDFFVEDKQLRAIYLGKKY